MSFVTIKIAAPTLDIHNTVYVKMPCTCSMYELIHSYRSYIKINYNYRLLFIDAKTNRICTNSDTILSLGLKDGDIVIVVRDEDNI